MNQKLSEDKTKEAIIISLLAKKFLLKVIQAVIFSINIYKQDTISAWNERKKLETKTGVIIVITCLCYDCWRQIIVYHYFIWLNVLFGQIKQNNVLMIYYWIYD